MQKINVFLSKSLDQVPRLLGQLNRSPRSKTYGCFDRSYWLLHSSYFANARKQEAMYTLAILYALEFEGNIYYGDPQILEWLRASLSYTRSIQHRDGSFDESFYNERSFVCTSFVLLSILETLRLLPELKTAAVEVMIKRAALFVREHYETVAYNQTAGNILALLLAGDNAAANKKLDRFLGDQDTEGWWPEYGGPDLGYLSLTIYYLEHIYTETKNDKVRKASEKAKEFLYNFLHPDFTCGGEYMSRNTEYLIPGSDKKILDFAAKQLEFSTAVWPGTMSDDYLLPLLSHWIKAGLNYGA